jgi:hypothetical protein
MVDIQLYRSLRVVRCGDENQAFRMLRRLAQHRLDAEAYSPSAIYASMGYTCMGRVFWAGRQV